ncbi:hypothetical protein CL634_02230 [bacterium]|nr:hypothetical protein [bacterium]
MKSDVSSYDEVHEYLRDNPLHYLIQSNAQNEHKENGSIIFDNYREVEMFIIKNKFLNNDKFFIWTTVPMASDDASLPVTFYTPQHVRREDKHCIKNLPQHTN